MNVSEALVEAMTQMGDHPAIVKLCNRMAYEAVREDARALVKKVIPPGLEPEVVEAWKRAFTELRAGRVTECNNILQRMERAIEVRA